MQPLTSKGAALVSLLAIGSLVSLPAARGNADTSAFPTIPESQWVGQRFVILPQSKALQHFGYQELYRDSDKEFTPLPYADFAGRIFRVVSIGHVNGPAGEKLEEADFQLEGDKKIIHGDIDHGCMTDVGPVSDLETARRLYLGKTLWLTRGYLNTYDAEKDTSDQPTSPAWHEAFQKIRIKQFSAVKVLDIVPGWYAGSPVRFIVQEAAGSEPAQGYIDVHMSDTNVPERLQRVDRFQDTFLESDPRLTYLWSPKVWTALENKEVLIGMTSQQVRMSWGEPLEIRRLPGQEGVEQWVYAPSYTLTLKDGMLATVATQPAPTNPPARAEAGSN